MGRFSSNSASEVVKRMTEMKTAEKKKKYEKGAIDRHREAMLLLVLDNIVLSCFRFDLGLGLVLFNSSFGKALSSRIFESC